jgi:hypothetical protein
VDGQPVVDQVGGQDVPEVVGREARLRERRVPLGQVGAPPCEHLGDGVVPEHRADGVHQSLEEEGHWWAVQLLPGVVAGHQRDRAASPCVPANHRGEDVKEVGGNRDDAFAVRLGRSDHEKRDDLPVGTLVLTHAELGQLQQFLDADPVWRSVWTMAHSQKAATSARATLMTLPVASARRRRRGRPSKLVRR